MKKILNRVYVIQILFFSELSLAVQCNDGTYSSSSGPGTCSHHGGVNYPGSGDMDIVGFIVLAPFLYFMYLYLFPGLFSDKNKSNKNSEVYKKNKKGKSKKKFKSRNINQNDYDKYDYEVGIINAAINEDLSIEFDYATNSGYQKRKIKPKDFVAFKNICVTGYCFKANEDRNFALIKMSNIKIVN